MRSTFLRRTGISLPLALALLLGACTAGSTATPGGSQSLDDCARVDADGVIVISADNLEFSVPCMVANAGEAFTIRFENREAQVHNVAVFTEKDGNEILRGDTITGPDATIDYEVEALDAGEYYFDCTIHPAMNGTLYVAEDAAA